MDLLKEGDYIESCNLRYKIGKPVVGLFKGKKKCRICKYPLHYVFMSSEKIGRDGKSYENLEINGNFYKVCINCKHEVATRYGYELD